MAWTEQTLAEALSVVYTHPSVKPVGWYVPPPNGTSVLIASPPDYSRLQYKSLRVEENWPSANLHLARESLFYCYCSPVDAKTGLAGDFAVTLCENPNAELRGHIEECLNVTLNIANYAEVGMPLSEIFLHAQHQIDSNGLINRTYSLTDPTSIDIGHSIPFSEGVRSSEEEDAIRGDDRLALSTLISKRRAFLNREETMPVPPTFAFTVEPRLASDKLPLVSFHTLIIFEGGEKTILANFRDLFDILGMSSLSKLLFNRSKSIKIVI